MNWKNRLTNYNFWISIVSAVLLILQAFEFHFDIMYINEIATAVLGLLVVIGIINDPTKTSKNEKNSAQKTDENNQDNLVENENKSTEEIQENLNQIIQLETEKISTTTNQNDSKNLNLTEEEVQNFPIDEQNKIVNINNKNDYENIVEIITNDIANEEIKIEEILKNLLNLLKNTEKTSKNAEIFENLLKNNENLDILDNDSIKNIGLETPIDNNENQLNNVDNLNDEVNVAHENLTDLKNGNSKLVTRENQDLKNEDLKENLNFEPLKFETNSETNFENQIIKTQENEIAEPENSTANIKQKVESPEIVDISSFNIVN